jgi:hypothetical protein
MNKWIKIVSSGVIAGVVTAVLLIASGLATSSVLTNEGTFTSTTVSLDVNIFAFLMIFGVSLAVVVVNFALEAASKPQKPNVNVEA